MYLSNERNIAMDGSQKYVVELSAEARDRLESVARNGSAPAKKTAQRGGDLVIVIASRLVMLITHEHHESGRYHDHQIAAALGGLFGRRRTVARDGLQPIARFGGEFNDVLL